MAGEPGSPVSRYFSSDKSSMRPPVSAIEPLMPSTEPCTVLLVLIGTRADVASAASREHGRRRRRRHLSGRLRPRLAGRGGCLRLLGLLLLLDDLLLLLLDGKPEEVLPHDKHQRGKRDRQDGVLLVGHRALSRFRPSADCRRRGSGCRCPLCRRSSAPSNSAAMRANGKASAARRPIST